MILSKQWQFLEIHSNQKINDALFLHLLSQEFVPFQNPKHKKSIQQNEFVSIIVNFNLLHMFNKMRIIQNVRNWNESIK
jgi:hypothetical protein